LPGRAPHGYDSGFSFEALTPSPISFPFLHLTIYLGLYGTNAIT
jgi:hypothetical protein